VQYVADGLFVADIPTAYASHLLGVCLVQLSEGIRIALPAPFYQPCHFHRKHDVSLYKVRKTRKYCMGMITFFEKIYILPSQPMLFAVPDGCACAASQFILPCNSIYFARQFNLFCSAIQIILLCNSNCFAAQSN
jgi:hypothetical protein